MNFLYLLSQNFATKKSSDTDVIIDTIIKET